MGPRRYDRSRELWFGRPTPVGATPLGDGPESYALGLGLIQGTHTGNTTFGATMTLSPPVRVTVTFGALRKAQPSLSESGVYPGDKHSPSDDDSCRAGEQAGHYKKQQYEKLFGGVSAAMCSVCLP